MRVFFVHQNFPGQLLHLARHLAAQPGHEVIAITKRRDAPIAGVKRVIYKVEDFKPIKNPLAQAFDELTRHGMAVRKAMLELKRRNLEPDIIVVHPGWGEAMFIQDVFPDVPRIDYCEILVSKQIRLFDPDDAQGSEIQAEELHHQRTAMHLFCLEKCTVGWSPTAWQKQTFPTAYQDKIRVLHDGIDTEKAKPNSAAQLELPNGRVLTTDDEVVTWAARNLEPIRGIRPFFRAAARLLERRANCHIVVAGGDGASYSPWHASGRPHREVMLEEVPLDPDRCHFLGHIEHDRFRSLLQISSAHLYLSMPYVLSWSALEAMSCGAALVASDTAPVRELITDRENGLLANYFAPDEIADRVEELLGDASLRQSISRHARQTILDHHKLDDLLVEQQGWLHELAGVRPPRAERDP